MTPARYQRVKEIFYRWCEAAPDERAALLATHCAGAPAIRAEVEAMIAQERAGPDSAGFLDRPVFGVDVVGSVLEASAGDRGMPATIGGYRVARRIGMGGMGVVYEAEQDSPRRTVALKIIRPGVASEGTLRRFEFEAQVLGRLQHPGIAQIFEAGTFDDGHGPQPYFAMELVRGPSLLEHARECELSVRDRLALVARVAAAVQHAHQHGVVHRDLKPDNILVQAPDPPSSGTGTGSSTTGGAAQPKILDFGVARVTDADVAVTAHQTDVGQLVGTIPYMSPEQARGRREEIDHRSDVYALGVITYELLAGRRPHDLAGRGVAEAVRIIEDEPAPRLGSVDRTLRGDVETIVAKALDRDPGARYATAAELAADIERCLADQPIVARPPSAVYQLRKFARRNRALVAGGVVAVSALLLGLIVAVVALAGALRSADRARHEQVVAAQVSAFLQETLAAVDPITGSPGVAHDLRDLLDAAARRAIDELVSPEVAAPVHLTIGRAYVALAAYDDARLHLDRARAMSERAFEPRSLPTAEAIDAIGALEMASGDYEAAQRRFEEALAIRREVAPPGDPSIGDGLNRLSGAQRALGDYTAAEATLRAALAIHEAALGPRDRAVADDLHDLGFLLTDTNALEEAEGVTRRALELRRELFGADHPSVAHSLSGLGWLHRRAHRLEAAEACYRESLAIQRTALDPDHPDVAGAIERLAAILEAQERLDEAEPLYREALALQRAALGPGHRDVGTTLNNIAGLCRTQGRYEEAEDLYLEALEIYREQIGPDHVWTAIVLENLSRSHELAGDFAAAEPYILDCLRIREAYFGARDEGDWPVAMARSLLALCRAQRGEFEAVEPMLLASVETIRTERGEEDRWSRAAAERAARFYEWWDRPEEAARWRQRAGK